MKSLFMGDLEKILEEIPSEYGGDKHELAVEFFEGSEGLEYCEFSLLATAPLPLPVPANVLEMISALGLNMTVWKSQRGVCAPSC